MPTLPYKYYAYYTQCFHWPKGFKSHKMNFPILLSLCAIAIYVFCGVLLGLDLAKGVQTGKKKRGKLLCYIGLVGVFFHGLVLYHVIFTPVGVNFSLFYSLSLVAWVAALLLPIASYGKPVENLGIVIYPVAAFCIILQLFFPGQRIFDAPGSWGIQAHIVLSVFAYSVLSLAAVQAILLHIQDSHLHHKHPGGFIRALPPLTTMETLLFEIILLGFMLLSMALLSGAFFIDNLFQQHIAHKTVLSIIAWVVFGVLLFGRIRFGWRGRTAITWTIAGFAFLVLAYFGSKLVLELVLHK